MADLLGKAVGFLGNIGLSKLNNIFGAESAELARLRNYQLNERAAQNADQRTRNLYNDLYSPTALLKQYNAAGLSPSLMFGGTPGQGGMSGAQGQGTAGQPNPYVPMSILEAAQASALYSQTEKTKAETENIKEQTKNVKEDTKSKEIQNEWNEMQKNQYKVEFTVMTSYLNTDEGNISPYEFAENFFTFDSFLKACRELSKGEFKAFTTTEAGVQTLRAIYTARHRMETYIQQLNTDKTNAEFQQSIIKALKQNDFEKLNAESAIGYLKANIQTAELTETQKSAWNNLLNKLGKNGSTTKDIIVVLGMLLNQAATQWKLPSINYNTTNNTTNNNG